MQLDNCHVVINFISRDNKSINFFASSTWKIKFTCFRNCFKNSFDDKISKKTIRFLKKLNVLSYKSICISFDIIESNEQENKHFETISYFSKNFVILYDKRTNISMIIEHQICKSIDQSMRMNYKKIENVKNEMFEKMHTFCEQIIDFVFRNASINKFFVNFFFAFTLRFRVSIDVFLLKIMLFLSIINRKQYFKIIVVVAISSSHEKNYINLVIEALTYLFLTLYYY